MWNKPHSEQNTLKITPKYWFRTCYNPTLFQFLAFLCLAGITTECCSAAQRKLLSGFQSGLAGRQLARGVWRYCVPALWVAGSETGGLAEAKWNEHESVGKWARFLGGQLKEKDKELNCEWKLFLCFRKQEESKTVLWTAAAASNHTINKLIRRIFHGAQDVDLNC